MKSIEENPVTYIHLIHVSNIANNLFYVIDF